MFTSHKREEKFIMAPGPFLGAKKPFPEVNLPFTSGVSRLFFCVMVLLMVLSGSVLHAQIPTTLTDKIYQGAGTIDLLKDLSADYLQQYLTTNGSLLLGVDLNENESGNESRTSLGVAIDSLSLVITTTAGMFTFSDFFTSTTAMIMEAGSTVADEYYTLFGKSGSSQLTGGTTDFALGSFDDVIRLTNIVFEGTLLGAQPNVTFLNTAKTSTQGNETFFDYSGGFEDFALLSKQDAAVLESANFGTTAAPSGITYDTSAPTITMEEALAPPPAPAPLPAPSSPGAPLPPLGLMVALGACVVWRLKRA